MFTVILSPHDETFRNGDFLTRCPDRDPIIDNIIYYLILNVFFCSERKINGGQRHSVHYESDRQVNWSSPCDL